VSLLYLRSDTTDTRSCDAFVTPNRFGVRTTIRDDGRDRLS
jgi:hypothetical protein